MAPRSAILACAILSHLAACGDARRIDIDTVPAELLEEEAVVQDVPFDSGNWPVLTGEAGEALSKALKASRKGDKWMHGKGRDGTRYSPEKLPELIAALGTQKAAMNEELRAMQQRLEAMPGGDSPSAELLELMNMYKSIFDEQFIGERSPPAIGLTNAEIRQIQESEFHMTANKLAAELLKSWRANGNPEYHDDKFDKRLVEVAQMLTYPQAKQSLSITGHLWTHLTNIFMLIVRSLRDLINRTPLTYNLGAVGITGSNLCNAAAREARETFLSGASTRGAHLMEFGIKWLLEKHQKVTRKLLMAMPRNKAYAEDRSLNAELDLVERSLLHDWTKSFKADHDAQLNKATLNIQQFKIQKMLHVMGRGSHNTQVNKDYQLTTCLDVGGAEGRDSTEFPSCKCGKDEESVYCGTEKVADRKFNATEVREHIACTYSEPYCASQPMKHELRDLAVLLDPVPTSDCSKLYDELVDSSVDQLVMSVGSQMFYLLYGTEEPIRKNPDFASSLYSRLKGAKTDEYIAKAFPSMGQRQKLTEQIEKKMASIAELEETQAHFRDAIVKGVQVRAPAPQQM